MKIFKLMTVFTIAFSMIFAGTVNATTFRDVPANHFAVDAVRWVSNPSNGSFMVGDASGNFNPGRVMDSFETAITLAMAAGFTYSPASITPALQAMFDRSYNRHSPAIAAMASQYTNWRRSADREIAFLMELGIITQHDLMRFMSGTAGSETPSNLTKEAAVAFVIRLSNNSDADIPEGITFIDAAQITPAYRSYAYIAHYLGVVTDYDGYFDPRRTVTRAELAQMFHVLRIAAPGTPGATASATAPQQSQPLPQAQSPFARTFHGTITGVNQEANSVQITSEYGTGAYLFGNDPIIMVNNVRRDITYLVPGMLVAVGLNESEQIISMIAAAAGTAQVPPLTTPAPVVPVPTPTPNPVVPVPMPTPTPVPTPGLVPTATVQGEIVGRHFVNAAPVVVVQDNNGISHNFFIAADTNITRNGNADNWVNLRFGDEVTVAVEFGRPVRLAALGNNTVTTGYIEEINITQNMDTIVVNSVRLALPTEVFDIYSLRLGMEVEVSADSREIYQLEVLDFADYAINGGFIGYVQSLRHGHTMVVTDNRDDTRHTIRVDGNTINTSTGETLNFRDIRSNMRLYIVILPEGNTAKSITILP